MRCRCNDAGFVHRTTHRMNGSVFFREVLEKYSEGSLRRAASSFESKHADSRNRTPIRIEESLKDFVDSGVGKRT
jgi:hypothetical protein